VNENLNFDEQILEAAKSIMNAASALITAATSAQKELVAQGKVSLKKQKYLNRIDILIDNKCDSIVVLIYFIRIVQQIQTINSKVVRFE
jgi:hypothetical protein